MKNKEVVIKSPGRTFLKSTQHIRVLDEPTNYGRSVLVGLQFGIVLLPYEIVAVVIRPLFSNILTDLSQAATSLLFVIRASFEAIRVGFTGHLDATDEPQLVDLDME
jgi:hypothetical protein